MRMIYGVPNCCGSKVISNVKVSEQTNKQIEGQKQYVRKKFKPYKQSYATNKMVWTLISIYTISQASALKSYFQQIMDFANLKLCCCLF